MIVLLQEEIQNKIGKKIKLGRDCTKLSQQISDSTGRAVSSTTLKRFFGIVETSFSPSKYTLESLAIFLGYEDWDDFQESAGENILHSEKDKIWESFKKPIQQVTENSMNSLKLKTNFDPQKFILRTNSRKKIEAFTKSSKTATMLVAHEGFGKSSTILQWVDNYLLSPHAGYENTVVLLIDGGTFFNLYAKYPQIDLLHDLVEFKLISSLRSLSEKHPELIKEPVWIIIDDVDEIFVENRQYHKFAENLMRLILTYSENKKTKVLLSCRPENMDGFASLARENPLFRSCWYDVDFSTDNMIQTQNIPEFSEDEIRSALKKINFSSSLKFLKVYHNDALDVLQHPNFLSILTEVYEEKKEISKIVILDRFVKNNLHSRPYRDEKVLVVEKFFELCNRAQKNTIVKKDQLPDKGRGQGYIELISHGLIYEYTRPNDEGIMANYVYVKFCQNLIFEFILIEQWLKDRILNFELIREIQAFYKDNDPLRCRLLLMLTNILLHDKDFDTIVRLHLEFEEIINPASKSMSQLPKCLVVIAVPIRKSMRYNKECREFLIPRLAKTRIGQILYFGLVFDIDSIMIGPGRILSAYNNRKPPVSTAFAHYMRFFQGFLSLNKEQCTKEYEKIQKTDWNNIHDPLISSYHYNVQIIYTCNFNGNSIHHLLPSIFAHADHLRNKKLQPPDALPEFELSIIHTLNLCEKYQEITELSNYVETHYDCSIAEGSPYYKYYRMCRARALLHEKHQKKAMEMFNSIVNLKFPDHMKHYMKINADLITVDFLLASNKNKEAKKLIKDIKHFASLLKFNFFIEKADKVLHEIS